jgi:hypothetical protein
MRYFRLNITAFAAKVVTITHKSLINKHLHIGTKMSQVRQACHNTASVETVFGKEEKPNRLESPATNTKLASSTKTTYFTLLLHLRCFSRRGGMICGTYLIDSLFPKTM